jgi:hypothetical protein
MTNKQIYKILTFSLSTFNREINTIREILSAYDVTELLDKLANEVMFCLHEDRMLNKIKNEIQLKVGEVIFNSQAKYIKIEKKMNEPIDSAKPPKFFLDFQNQMLQFQKLVIARFDKLDNRIDNLVKLNSLKE